MWSPARSRNWRPRLVCAVLLAGAAASPLIAQLQQDFAGAMRAAMDRMMADMHATSTGEVDRDFVAMMEPHHRGAIDMAVAELRFGRNEQLKRIAQGIIVEQQQEIAAMRLAVGLTPPAPSPVPTLPSAPAHHMHKEN